MRSIVILLFSVAHASAQVFVVSSTQLDMAIPDGQLAGINHQLTVDAPFAAMGEVRVTLQIDGLGNDGAFNGDLYATLVHGDDKAVLLNRVGRSTANPVGYSDNGLNVTFSDAAEHDIHNYADSAQLGLGESLTGEWQPDGRDIGPNAVLDTTTRTGFLDQFQGTNPDGSWTLFLADSDFGGTARLVRWELEFIPVPEPDHAVWVAIGCAALAIFLRRIRHRNASKATYSEIPG
jgi:subtilisin-like proprotein convertase family protein